MIETSAHQLSSLATAIFLVGAMLTPIVIANEIAVPNPMGMLSFTKAIMGSMDCG